MAFLSNLASGAIGYGLGRHHKNERNEEEHVKELRSMSLRQYLDAYRDANHIVLDTTTADSFIFELEQIVHDYKLGI